VNLAPSVADRLAAAKLWVISTGAQRGGDSPRDLPYLAHALYALVPVPSTDIATMSCDEHWRVYLNADWVQAAPVRDIGAELVHLVWHLLHDHANRARDLHVDADTAPHWTRSTDVAIEHTLRADDLAPATLPTAASLGKPCGLSAEEYYAALSGLPATCAGRGEPAEPGCGSGCDGVARSTELPPGLDLGEVGPEDARQIRRTVAIAYREHVTDRGTQPGDAWRWTKEILEPTIAWEPLLGAAVRRAVAWTNGNTHYTYTRRSRRQSAVPRVVLPGTRRPVPNVALIIDTSGSVDDTLLSRALGEVDGALTGLGVSGSSVTVLACDAAVHAVTRVRKARDARLAGGGGTDMRAGIAAATELRPKPDVLVVFTDGHTPWPHRPPPATAVIAAILGRREHVMPPSPAWARRIECHL
jgi:predicted metal-dependent peptidase